MSDSPLCEESMGEPLPSTPLTFLTPVEYRRHWEHSQQSIQLVFIRSTKSTPERLIPTVLSSSKCRQRLRLLQMVCVCFSLQCCELATVYESHSPFLDKIGMAKFCHSSYAANSLVSSGVKDHMLSKHKDLRFHSAVTMDMWPSFAVQQPGNPRQPPIYYNAVWLLKACVHCHFTALQLFCSGV